MNSVDMNSTDTTRTADVEAIEQVVAAVERAQRHESVEDFLALFRPDAVWTTAHGKRLTGRAEIADFTRRVLPGAMADLRATYEVVHVLFIRPDVAAVKVRQRYSTRDGSPIDGRHEGSPLYVMSKEDGRWLLAACQNTEVLDS